MLIHDICNASAIKIFIKTHCYSIVIMDNPRPKRKKETRSVTLSPYLLEKMDTLVENEEFSSTSDLITIGMSDFLVRYNLKKDEISAMDILVKMLQMPEGKRAFDKISSETKESVQLNTFQKLPLRNLNSEGDNYFTFINLLDAYLKTPEGKKAFDKITSNTPAVRQAESTNCITKKDKEAFLREMCPEPRELTPREAELAAIAKEKEYYSRRNKDEEEVEEETQTASSKKSNKRVLFDKDIPREYILE